MPAHLEIRAVSKRYARTVAVERLSLTVPRGVIYGLLGPNGAGKTTTIRMVMRITLPDEGEILLGGTPVDDDVRERIGYLPEERGLYRKMKVLEHLAFLGEVRGLDRSEARRRATAWLAKLGLADKAAAKVEELSKGMQQKVQLAGAVLHAPEIVVLDEPFSALDPIATRQLKDEMLAMRKAGTTVLLSTHVLPQAEELCEHICLINRGRAILAGKLDDVRARFAGSVLRIESAAADADLAAVAGVEPVWHSEGGRLLVLAAGVGAPAVIREVARLVPVEGVEPYVSTLEEIFLRAVEADHAAVA
jgi:ABC-2 type transport system ATP-binding protein